MRKTLLPVSTNVINSRPNIQVSAQRKTNSFPTRATQREIATPTSITTYNSTRSLDFAKMNHGSLLCSTPNSLSLSLQNILDKEFVLRKENIPFFEQRTLTKRRRLKATIKLLLPQYMQQFRSWARRI
ncbi:hypothetical protein CEXT_684941 [Caerostris extrusa]|uniref:Ribosomal protein S18 n=1 Tax=Caerostris extrusa TaxID=172846 RepID=A0AAV4Y5B4_CAEEX|nr:hypothetical protein CEXT_684941 [Caerostris extrusa]